MKLSLAAKAICREHWKADERGCPTSGCCNGCPIRTPCNTNHPTTEEGNRRYFTAVNEAAERVLQELR